MLKTNKIVLTILMVVLLLLIPNIVKAGGEYFFELEITVPELLEGNKIIPKEEIIVTADKNQNFEVTDRTWAKAKIINDNQTGVYSRITDSSETFQQGYKYCIDIVYKRPKNYKPKLDTNGNIDAENFSLKLNGVKLDATDTNVFYCGTGDEDYETDVVSFEFGECLRKYNITFDEEALCVLRPDFGEVKFSPAGKTIRVTSMRELKEGDDWKITVKDTKENNIDIKETVLDDGEKYYEFVMPEDNVNIDETYLPKEGIKEEIKEEKTEEKEEAKEEKDKTPKTGIEGTKVNYIAIGIASLAIISGAVTLIKKK